MVWLIFLKSNHSGVKRNKSMKLLKKNILSLSSNKSKNTLNRLFLKGLGIKLSNIKGHKDCQCLMFWNIAEKSIVDEITHFFKQRSLIPYFASTKLIDQSIIDRYKWEYKKLIASGKHENCHLLYPLLLVTNLTEQEIKTLSNPLKFSIMKILMNVLKNQDQTLEEHKTVTFLNSYNLCFSRLELKIDWDADTHVIAS